MHSRRQFLMFGTCGLLGLRLSDMLRLEAADVTNKSLAHSMILIWLGGGPSTIDMWDPKPDAPSTVRGEFSTIATDVPGLSIGEHLPLMAKTMRHCVVVRSLHHSIPAHGPGSSYLLTGHRPEPAIVRPSLGSLASGMLTAQPGIPSYVTFGSRRGDGPGFLGTAYRPFEVTSDRNTRDKLDGLSLPEAFTPDDLRRRSRLRDLFEKRFSSLSEASDTAASLREFQHKAFEILVSETTNRAFDLRDVPAADQHRYGTTEFGRNTLIARRLVEAGTRFVTVGLDGWDTHTNNFLTLRNRLLPQLDRALSALVSDLHETGRLQSTIVCCVGEFGRTPTVNSTAGRDHWARAMSLVLAGGGFKPGEIYGSTDDLGATPIENPCSPEDLSVTLLDRIGIDPQTRVKTVSGREMTLFRDGQVLCDLKTAS